MRWCIRNKLRQISLLECSSWSSFSLRICFLAHETVCHESKVDGRRVAADTTSDRKMCSIQSGELKKAEGRNLGPRGSAGMTWSTGCVLKAKDLGVRAAIRRKHAVWYPPGRVRGQAVPKSLHLHSSKACEESNTKRVIRIPPLLPIKGR